MNAPAKCPICRLDAIRSSSGILCHTRSGPATPGAWTPPPAEICPGSTPGAKADPS